MGKVGANPRNGSRPDAHERCHPGPVGPGVQEAARDGIGAGPGAAAGFGKAGCAKLAPGRQRLGHGLAGLPARREVVRGAGRLRQGGQPGCDRPNVTGRVWEGALAPTLFVQVAVPDRKASGLKLSPTGQAGGGLLPTGKAGWGRPSPTGPAGAPTAPQAGNAHGPVSFSPGAPARPAGHFTALNCSGVLAVPLAALVSSAPGLTPATINWTLTASARWRDRASLSLGWPAPPPGPTIS